MSLVKTLVVSCNSCGSSDYDLVSKVRDYGLKTCENEFEYVSCKSCSHIYLRNRPDISELATIYPANYTTYSYNEYLGPFLTRLRGIVQKMKIRAILDFAEKEALIADVGCGNGELLRILRQFGPKTWSLVGIDFSEHSAQQLERLGLASITERYEDLNWGDKKPNVIIMNQVIEHLEDPKKAIDKSYEYLATNGILFIETPSAASWDYFLFKNRYWGGWHCPRHWNIYRPDSLKVLLESAGFEVIKVEFLLNPYAWLHSFQYYIGDKLGLKRLASCFQESVLITTAFVSFIDVMQKLMVGRTSNLRIIAKKL